MDDATQAAILSTVSGLSDSQLLEQTGKLARLDRQIQAFVIDHLIEIESRKLYLSRGFSSPFDYVTRGLGYSSAAAWRRIGAMKLCAHVEGARERLWDGSLTLDAAAQLQAAFERRDRERARAARRAEASVGAARRRNGSALEAPALVPPPEPKPTPELDVSTRKALVEAAAGKSSRQVIQMLAEMDPELAVPADRVRPLGGERWELKAVIDEECQRGLEQLKGLAVSRRSAHDAGAARRTPGAGGAQSPRSGPAAARSEIRQPTGRRRANFGAELGRRCYVGGPARDDARGCPQLDGEGANGPGPRRPFGEATTRSVSSSWHKYTERAGQGR